MKPGLLQDVWNNFQATPESHSRESHIDVERASLAGWICLHAAARTEDHTSYQMPGRTITYHGQRWDVPELACLLTGITPCEGRWLFHLNRTMDELTTGVEAVLDDRAIPGLPYQLFPDTDQRYMCADGRITVVVHRRTAMVKIRGGLHHTQFATRQAANESAYHVARDSGATLIPRQHVTYARSLPA